MRQSIAENVVLPFPIERRIVHRPLPENKRMDAHARMSLRFCFAVWFVLVLIGWGAVDAFTALI